MEILVDKVRFEQELRILKEKNERHEQERQENKNIK